VIDDQSEEGTISSHISNSLRPNRNGLNWQFVRIKLIFMPFNKETAKNYNKNIYHSVIVILIKQFILFFEK